MPTVEVEGDIDEAINAALGELQVGRSEVHSEILGRPSPGLFGIGRRRARVRATLATPSERRSPKGDVAQPVVSRETPGAAVQEGPLYPVVGWGAEVPRELLDRMGIEATVRKTPGESDDATLRLEVTGEVSGLLTGRRGQTMDAVEYVLNRMLFRGDQDAPRVIPDVEGYRARRVEYLQTLARRSADRAKKNATVVRVNSMRPEDRRIVHLALREYPQVDTRSEGGDYYKRLLILPVTTDPRRRRAPSRDR